MAPPAAALAVIAALNVVPVLSTALLKKQLSNKAKRSIPAAPTVTCTALDELESIWKLLCKEKGYAVGDDVSAVVRRRLSKQSGYKGFGNARSVRKLFESAALPAMHRYRVDSSAGKQVELSIVMEDVIGQRPDRRTNTKVAYCSSRCRTVLCSRLDCS